MNRPSRREFLSDVGKGMLVAGLGSALAADLGLSAYAAEAGTDRLTFGELEPLVALMQDTPIDKLQPLLVEKLNRGVDLKTLTAAGALANARTFGGHDYVGYHTMMALLPAYRMSQLLPSEQSALPVLKVLYRNTNQIHSFGGSKNEVLEHLDAHAGSAPADGAEALREAMHDGDMQRAEKLFASLMAENSDDAFNDLQQIVQEEINVHRIVLAWRSWDIRHLTGPEHAHTLLRQSLHFCVNSEIQRNSRNHPAPSIRALLPKLLDEHKLVSRQLGTRRAEDAQIEELCQTVFASGRDQAAEAVAAALAEGMAPEDVGEAISLAANQLVLHDPGRTKAYDGKPVGSVHGDSVGVHASDAANAWRNVARASDQRNAVASLIVGAYHTAGQMQYASKTPYPYAEQLETIQTDDAQQLLAQTAAAVRSNDQARAAALIDRYGSLGHSDQPAFDLLLQFAVSEDGALHAEKYYHTVKEEFQRSRPAFRWRHLTALARVTASEFGYPAPGRQQAVELLNV